ncbi:MAG: hypothetical protein DMG65_04500 [Candidatus Angelobacter sp. Gp1-AA117]|nr:MAG: hypothetical protein DMG65_04500 [Candidatus Angelobacter sp. Gp1-AA117]
MTQMEQIGTDEDKRKGQKPNTDDTDGTDRHRSTLMTQMEQIGTDEDKRKGQKPNTDDTDGTDRHRLRSAQSSKAQHR